MTIGRSDGADVALVWDGEVSRLHAQLEAAAGEWLLVDDGLSRNGTFVNGQRVVGAAPAHRRRALRVGATVMLFRSPRCARRRCARPRSGHRRPALRDPATRAHGALPALRRSRSTSRRRRATSRSATSSTSASMRSRPTCAGCTSCSASRGCRRTRSARARRAGDPVGTRQRRPSSSRTPYHHPPHPPPLGRADGGDVAVALLGVAAGYAGWHSSAGHNLELGTVDSRFQRARRRARLARRRRRRDRRPDGRDRLYGRFRSAVASTPR